MKAFLLGIAFLASPALAQQQFQQDTVTLTPPTQYEDNTPLAVADILEYRVYWSAATGGPYTLSFAITPPATSGVYSRSPPYTGKRCYVATTVMKSGIESLYSNEACKTVSRPKTIVIQIQ